MRDDLQYRARRIFAEFIDSFEERGGRRDWWIDFTEDTLESIGMTYDEAEGALQLLDNEGLIERVSMDGWRLSDEGYRACIHRELIDEALGSPAAAGGFHLQVVAQHVIFGNNNTLQVNSDEVMRQLITHLQADKSLPAEKRSQWVEILKEVTGHVAAEGLKVLIDEGKKAAGL
ncbi:MAG TPA: hypothetical protein VJN18_14475 [Polyangiaceae bacterium]|nr:hypothetical protein [Polyangiaceae bacterium]